MYINILLINIILIKIYTKNMNIIVYSYSALIYLIFLIRLNWLTYLFKN